ncbi:MAG: NADPH-dependent F420 reductase [Burkholderiales bacterium]
MAISIIGAGNVGMALARALTRKGERILFGVPDPGKYRDAAASLGGLAEVGSTADAIARGDVVILAVPYGAALEIARSVADWKGKILVDATNPLAAGLTGLTVGTASSGAEEIAAVAHGARVVKAFNTTGAENMENASYPSGSVFMPVCGDDAQARARVIALATSIGFDAVDCGELAAARYLEPFAMTWIHMAIKLGHGRRFAFARLKR